MKWSSLCCYQTKHDLFTFGETIKDYIALLGAIRVRVSLTPLSGQGKLDSV